MPITNCSLTCRYQFLVLCNSSFVIDVSLEVTQSVSQPKSMPIDYCDYRCDSLLMYVRWVTLASRQHRDVTVSVFDFVNSAIFELKHTLTSRRCICCTYLSCTVHPNWVFHQNPARLVAWHQQSVRSECQCCLLFALRCHHFWHTHTDAIVNISLSEEANTSATRIRLDLETIILFCLLQVV